MCKKKNGKEAVKRLDNKRPFSGGNVIGMASSSIKSPPPPPYPYDEKMYSQYRVSEPWGPDHPEDPATVEKLCSHLRKKPDFHQLDRGCVVMISSLSHCERCVQVRSALGQYIHVPRTRMALGETVPLVCYFCNDEDFQMSDVKEAFKHYSSGHHWEPRPKSLMTLELFYDLYSHLSRTSNKFDRQYSRALRRFKRLEDKLVIRTKRTAAVPEPPTLVVERKTEDVGIQTTPPSVPAAEENQEPEPQQPRHVVARRFQKSKILSRVKYASENEEQEDDFSSDRRLQEQIDHTNELREQLKRVNLRSNDFQEENQTLRNQIRDKDLQIRNGQEALAAQEAALRSLNKIIAAHERNRERLEVQEAKLAGQKVKNEEEIRKLRLKNSKLEDAIKETTTIAAKKTEDLKVILNATIDLKAVREGSEKANLELARAEVELERAKLEIERLKKELVETTTTSQKIKTEEKPQTTQKTNCLVKEFVGKRLTRARKPAAEVAEHQSTEKGRKSPIKNPREENQCNKTTNPGPILARTGKRNYSLVEAPLDGGNVPEEDEEDELDDEEVEEEEDDDEEDNRMLARRVTRSARVAEDKDDSLKGILNKPKPKNRKLISL